MVAAAAAAAVVVVVAADSLEENTGGCYHRCLNPVAGVAACDYERLHIVRNFLLKLWTTKGSKNTSKRKQTKGGKNSSCPS